MRKFLLIIIAIVLSNYGFGQHSRFYPNGNIKETHYSTHTKCPVYACSKEDLFQRGIKYDPNDSTLVDVTINDSIVYFRYDGRIDRKRYFGEINGEQFKSADAHYVYAKNKSLIRIDTQYWNSPQEISFSNNILTLKPRPDKIIRGSENLPMTKVGYSPYIPLIIRSELDEAVVVIIKDYSKSISVSDTYFELEPNQDGKISLNFSVDRTRQNYRLEILVQSHKETYHVNLTYHVKGFHFSEDYLKKAVGITHENNRELAIKFNNNHQRSIKIYKGKEVVLEKQSTDDYALLRIYKLEKGDYTLEIIDEVTKEKINPLLILK